MIATKGMLQEALNYWDFSAYSDPEEGRQAKKALRYAIEHPDARPTNLKSAKDWDTLSEWASNFGYELER